MASEKFYDGQTFYESLDPATDSQATSTRQEIYASDISPDTELSEDDDGMVPLDEILEEAFDEAPEVGFGDEVEAKTALPRETNLSGDLLAAVEALEVPDDYDVEAEQTPELVPSRQDAEMSVSDLTVKGEVIEAEQEADVNHTPVVENREVILDETDKVEVEKEDPPKTHLSQMSGDVDIFPGVPEETLFEGELDEVRGEQSHEPAPRIQEAGALVDGSITTVELLGLEAIHTEGADSETAPRIRSDEEATATPDFSETETLVAAPEIAEPEGETAELPGIEVLQSQKGSFEELKKLTDTLEFTDIAKPNSDRPIAKPERFSFTPLMSDDPTMYRSMTPAGSLAVVEEGINCTYGADRDRKPYLDTRQAIGLVYKDDLIAVAGAGLEQGRLKIIQIQDVTGLRKEGSGRDFYKTGLHNGFNWRDALVTAWEEIGRTVGVEQIVIQSSQNNTWPQIQKAGYPAYDGVAKRLGYELEHGTLDWVKTLSEPGTEALNPEPEPEGATQPRTAERTEIEPETTASRGTMRALKKILGLERGQ